MGGLEGGGGEGGGYEGVGGGEGGGGGSGVDVWGVLIRGGVGWGVGGRTGERVLGGCC